MNKIFLVIVTLSLIFLSINSPEKIMNVIMSASKKALSLSFELLCVYSFWLGILKILSDTNLTNKISRLLNTPIDLLFGKIPNSAKENISLCFSSNLLGIGGVATPLAIKSIDILENDLKYPNNAITMLFVINATSLQLLPTSVIALRSLLSSVNPSNIILPSLICTFMTTLIGIILVKITNKRVKDYG